MRIMITMLYSSSLKARNTYGRGTRANVIDWKTGRIVECLSQGEKWTFICLRWDDCVIDIREQFPMNSARVAQIAEGMDIPIPHNELSTDFLVQYSDGSFKAVSVKNSEKDLENKRIARRQALEKRYWESLGIPWVLIYKSRINRIRVDNIRICVRYYDPESVCDPLSLIAHRIARKEIPVDIDCAILDFRSLAAQYMQGETA